jgi:thymidylate kinase
MLIFIEGIDKAGKSTLARAISERTNISVYRKSTPSNIRYSDRHIYFKGMSYALAELHRMFLFHALIDRSFISDWVYTNKDRITIPMSIWHEWEQIVGYDNAFVIYVEIPLSELSARIRQLPDRYMRVEDYWPYVRLYDQYLESTNFAVCRVPGNLPLHDQWKKLESELMACPHDRVSTQALHLLGFAR